MNTNPSKPIGFRPSQGSRSTQATVRSVTRERGRMYVGWRFWIGPLLVARTPGIGCGITVGWTR